MSRSIKYPIILLLLAGTCLFPAMAVADDIDDQLQAVVREFDEEIRDAARQKPFVIAAGAFFDAATRMEGNLSARVEDGLFNIVLKKYTGRRGAVVVNWKSRQPFEKAGESGSGTPRYNTGAAGKRLIDQYGSGFLITGFISTARGPVDIQAELIDLSSGDVLASFGEPTAAMKTAAPPVATAPAATPASAGGRLKVDTAPANARVKLVDSGEPLSPDTVLTPGRYRVEISADGYVSRIEWLTVSPGQETTLRVQLDPMEKAEPLESKVIEGKNFRYEGTVKDGMKHGRGSLIFASGDSYEGEWQNDRMHGEGTYTFKDGDKYSGEWKVDKMHGHGTYTFKSGDRYVGEFRNDVKDGKGTYFFKNGDKWEGSYKNNQKDGDAVYTWASGQTKAEVWKDGKRVE